MKASHISLLILSAVACASALSCQWKGTAPSCGASPRDCVGKYNHYWTFGKCGDGAMCVTGYKVYCCDEPSPYSILYWMGTAPFCNAGCNNCFTGDDCIQDNNCGDGAQCWSGSKILCGRKRTTSSAELQELLKISEYTKAQEQKHLNMALLMGGYQVQAMQGPDPGLVLAYVNSETITN